MVDRESLSKVETAIRAIKDGHMVIMVDEEDRENEGDLVFAAEHCTPQMVNFMAKEARGLICLTLETALVERLNLPMMDDATKTSPSQGTAFTVSIEAKQGVTTGISAADRSHTIKVAIDEKTGPADIVVPGHIFPLKARPGGVLERAGHTEGSVDLARLAGCKGAGVICEIMNDDGTMARMPDLVAFSKQHDIPIIAISDLIQYKLEKEPIVKEIERRHIITAKGTFESVIFQNTITQRKHFSLIKGSDFHKNIVDVRVHHARPLADVFGTKDGAGFRVDYGLNMLNQTNHGVFIYLTDEEPRNDLMDIDIQYLSAHHEADKPTGNATRTEPSRPMDERLLGTGAQILRGLGVKEMRIHTTSKRNFVGLGGYGLKIVESQTMQIPKRKAND